MVLCSQFAIGALNEYCDAESDARAKPMKPIAAGLVPRAAALVIALAGVVITLILAASFGPATVALAVLATAAGLVYDFPLKRTPLSWLPYVAGLPLLPLWAWAAAGHVPRAAGWAYPIGVLLALSLHIANALPDDLDDRRAGTIGLVQLVGRHSSMVMLVCSFCTAGGLALALVAFSGGSQFWQPTVALIGLLCGSLAIALLFRSSTSTLAFKILAVASALLAIAVASALAA